MVSLNSAREAVALAHVVPGSELTVTMSSGRVLHFRSDRPSEGLHLLSPCTIRMVLVCSQQSPRDVLADVSEIALGGCLRHDEAGLFSRPGFDGTEWWFATSMAPDRVGEIVESCDVDLPDEAMNARVCGDSQLGMSAVSIRANHPAFEDHSRDIARWCLVQCMVAEITEPAAVGWGVAVPATGHRSNPTND